MNTDIYFSIVIPARNEAENIRRCIESVLANNDDIGYEIVCADNHSADNTVAIIKSLGVAALEKTPGTIGAVRNAGASQTRGPILVFMDADIQVPPDWLKKAKVWFDAGFSGALGFTDNAPSGSGWVARTWGDRLYQKLDKVVDAGYLPGRNLFINRRVFEEIGGFDETLETNEDKDLSIRVRSAGYRVISIPETRLYHLGCEKNLAEFVRKEFWRQGSSLAAARRLGFSPRSLRAPLLSLWHLLLLPAIPISLLAGEKRIAFFLLAAWLGPAAAIVRAKLSPASPWPFVLAFFWLTFLRWNVAGAALVKQLIGFLFTFGTRTAATVSPKNQ